MASDCNPIALRRPFVQRTVACVLFLAALGCLLALPASVLADTAGTRVAVVNTERVFNEMKETKALQTRMSEEQKKLEAERQARLAAMTKAKLDRDNTFKAGTQQWEEANQGLMKAAVDYKIWLGTAQATTEYEFKRQFKQLFDKVQAAVAEVAKKEGYDIVIADNNEKLPDELDQVDLRALQALLLRKNVMFASEKVDITSQVTLVLDAKYKAVAPAVPAVGGAPVLPTGK